MATVYFAVGSQVTVIELADQIAPGSDKEAASILHQAIEAQGVSIHTSTKAVSVKATKATLTLTCEGTFQGDIKADVIIQAVGRKSNGPLVKPEAAGVAISDRGIIEVGATCET